MKKITGTLFIAAIIAGACSINSCRKAEDSNPAGVAQQDVSGSVARHENSLVFPINAHMHGKSYAEWSEQWWKWIFSFDCAHSPLFDQTGALQDQNQHGDVYFVGGGGGGPAITRSITIKKDQSLFFPLVNYYANYPCSGAPAPGESMQHFLTGQVMPFKAQMDQLSLTVDGVSVGDLTDYWALTDLFNYTGNPDLANCFDACINGQRQPAVSGGFWIMLKPLHHGNHVVHATGGASAFGFLVDVTYNVTVH